MEMSGGSTERDGGRGVEGAKEGWETVDKAEGRENERLGRGGEE